MNRLCLDCQAPLQGRADKKFCDDQCRTSFNNLARAQDNSFLKMINQILKKNREILKSKTPKGTTKIRRDALLRRGFDFSYHTHTFVNKNGSTYFFCYEFGYLLLEHDEVLLVRRNEC